MFLIKAFMEIRRNIDVTEFEPTLLRIALNFSLIGYVFLFKENILWSIL